MHIDDKPQSWIDEIDEDFRKSLDNRTEEQIESSARMMQAEEAERELEKANEW